MTKREVVSTQQSAPAPTAPITSGHTTLTFSGTPKSMQEETYINKVYQQNDVPTPKKVLLPIFSGNQKHRNLYGMKI